MKYVKILGLLAVAAAAMMAFAASASADTVTTTTAGGVVDTTPTIHAVNEGTHVSLHNPEVDIECHSTLEGTVQRHETNKPVEGTITTLHFTSCTEGWTVSGTGGELTLEALGGNTGTLVSHSATVTATLNLIFFHITCRYKTANTHIGTVTGGNPATLHIEASIPFHSGSGACGTAPSAWTGSYVTTEALDIDET